MSILYIGIDPGIFGAVAAFDDSGAAEWWPMPIIGGDRRGSKREISTVGLVRLFEDLKLRGSMQAALESVGARPGQGVTSMFNFGKGVGRIEGVLVALRISYALVAPQSWKRRVLEGSAKDKTAAIKHCQAKWPALSLIPERGRVAHDGAADALCMAEYARRFT